jgi:hypothetical protein
VSSCVCGPCAPRLPGREGCVTCVWAVHGAGWRRRWRATVRSGGAEHRGRITVIPATRANSRFIPPIVR